MRLYAGPPADPRDHAPQRLLARRLFWIPQVAHSLEPRRPTVQPRRRTHGRRARAAGRGTTPGGRPQRRARVGGVSNAGYSAGGASPVCLARTRRTSDAVKAAFATFTTSE